VTAFYYITHISIILKITGHADQSIHLKAKFLICCSPETILLQKENTYTWFISIQQPGFEKNR